MSKIGRMAMKFVAENKLERLDYESLKLILENIGFEIIRFNRKDLKLAALFVALGIDEATTRSSCFTYINDNDRYVFLEEHLSEKEYIFMLLHEIGHIKLEHLLKNCTYTSNLDEIEADEFAFEVIRCVDKRSKLAALIKTTLFLLIVALAISLLVFCLNQTDQKEKSSSLDSKEENSIIDSIEETGDTDVYYVTSSGEKYHRGFCTAIKGKDNLFSGSREELEEKGYEPCKMCIGEDNNK